MNYSTIQVARENLNKYERNYKSLVTHINLSLFSLTKTTLSEKEKEKAWEGLLKSTKIVIREVENELEKINNVRFSEDEIILEEEKEQLINKYRELVNNLQSEKATVLRQMQRQAITAIPLQQKSPKVGYCYFCDIDIRDGFAYKLKEEQQKILEIEVVEGAEFCSQECLLNHCKEYKNREKERHEVKKRNEEKIENNKRLVTEIQEKINQLIGEINELEKREIELELMPEDEIPSPKKKPGFFRRIGQKVGLAKKDNPLPLLERVKNKKTRLNLELENSQKELKNALIMLTISEQVEEEREKTEKKLSEKRGKITGKKREEE